MNAQRVCSVEECGKSHEARGFCSIHYKRYLREHKPQRLYAEKGAGLAFLAEALAAETAECIIWPFAKDKDGYPIGYVDSTRVPLHRYVCGQRHGPQPPGQMSCHSCGNRACINKRHVRWGTAQENSDDMALHGTAARGEKHHNTPFTAADVIAIRASYPALTQMAIAAHYGVTPTCINYIILRKTWKHI